MRGQIGKIDVLQLGHHGDGTIGGTPRWLIDECKPKFAYFASTFLADFISGVSDVMNISTTFKHVSWHYAHSMTHGNGHNGHFKYVFDGTNVVTNGTTTFAKNLWYEREPNVWYYFKEDGYLCRNEWLLDKEQYFYFGDNYVMYANQWLDYNGAWYYLKANGAMAKNETININGKDYIFSADGGCVNP